MLYQTQGKLFIYFNQEGIPISMNGCIFNYENDTVAFTKDEASSLKSIYFYGLSTLKAYRGKGACRELIKFVIDFAKHNDFDLVYARTDLVNSNSEWIMEKSGMKVCTINNLIIAEWVDVTETIGDYRLHMWLPLKEGIHIQAKRKAVFANNDQKRDLIPELDINLLLSKTFN